MAISKTQNERPAIISLIDASNSQENNINNINNNLQSEITTRENENIDIRVSIANEISNRITAVQNVQNQVLLLGNEVNSITTQIDNIADDLENTSDAVIDIQGDLTSISSDVANLLLFEGKIQIGNINNLIIPANDSLSTSETFAEPFDENSNCIVFAQVITSELSTLFNFTLIDCTYSGFSYSISNSDADSHTVSLGYIAIRTSN